MFPTNRFKNKKILIGITGGIAAYKITELVRYLITNKAEVRIIMTAAAEKFITRLTLETLSQNPVMVEMFPDKIFHKTHHINLADWAEAAIIAPATYNFIGKLHAGIADDLLTATAAALHCPIVIAPAMNSNMWNNKLLQRNIKDLSSSGFLVCPPEEGFLAEGYRGMGRLAPPEHLVQYLYHAIHPAKESLTGKKVLVSAGRTEEAIDPVRFLTNKSSGKMGYALAWEAFARRADVTLIHGPTKLINPESIHTISTRSASEMVQEVKKHLQKTDIYAAAAAIADYTPEKIEKNKIKKKEGDLQLALKRTEDVLAFAGENKQPGQKLVGFAVETRNGEKNAIQKLQSKNLDLIILNNPVESGAGFQSDTNRVAMFACSGKNKKLPMTLKLDVAFEIFDFLLSES